MRLRRQQIADPLEDALKRTHGLSLVVMVMRKTCHCFTVVELAALVPQEELFDRSRSHLKPIARVFTKNPFPERMADFIMYIVRDLSSQMDIIITCGFLNDLDPRATQPFLFIRRKIIGRLHWGYVDRCPVFQSLNNNRLDAFLFSTNYITPPTRRRKGLTGTFSQVNTFLFWDSGTELKNGPKLWLLLRRCSHPIVAYSEPLQHASIDLRSDELQLHSEPKCSQPQLCPFIPKVAPSTSSDGVPKVRVRATVTSAVLVRDAGAAVQSRLRLAHAGLGHVLPGLGGGLAGAQTRLRGATGAHLAGLQLRDNSFQPLWARATEAACRAGSTYAWTGTTAGFSSVAYQAGERHGADAVAHEIPAKSEGGWARIEAVEMNVVLWGRHHLARAAERKGNMEVVKWLALPFNAVRNGYVQMHEWLCVKYKTHAGLWRKEGGGCSHKT
ncbi:hypothetical protein ON010_g13306 [Phytophthora cinnamomi]|nr:hypothetical protein ON010_g13306 [Phytophthora cinnamomi]